MRLFNYIAKLFIRFEALFEVDKNYKRAINPFPITSSLVFIPLAWGKASSHSWQALKGSILAESE